jgi:hypothetical protein
MSLSTYGVLLGYVLAGWRLMSLLYILFFCFSKMDAPAA